MPGVVATRVSISMFIGVHVWMLFPDLMVVERIFDRIYRIDKMGRLSRRAVARDARRVESRTPAARADATPERGIPFLLVSWCLCGSSSRCVSTQRRGGR